MQCCKDTTTTRPICIMPLFHEPHANGIPSFDAKHTPNFQSSPDYSISPDAGHHTCGSCNRGSEIYAYTGIFLFHVLVDRRLAWFIGVSNDWSNRARKANGKSKFARRVDNTPFTVYAPSCSFRAERASNNCRRRKLNATDDKRQHW